MINIDMWYKDNPQEADRISIFLTIATVITGVISTRMGKQSAIIPLTVPQKSKKHLNNYHLTGIYKEAFICGV